MPKLETVHIHNPSHSQPLHLNSISGDSPVFHASFFKSKVEISFPCVLSSFSYVRMCTVEMQVYRGCIFVLSFVKVLKAGESTTFDVIFLARVTEDVQTSLYIQTSLGTFDYKVYNHQSSWI